MKLSDIVSSSVKVVPSQIEKDLIGRDWPIRSFPNGEITGFLKITDALVVTNTPGFVCWVGDNVLPVYIPLPEALHLIKKNYSKVRVNDRGFF